MSKIIDRMNLNWMICDDCKKVMSWKDSFYTVTIEREIWGHIGESTTKEKYDYHMQCGPYSKDE